jgi:hypothetical protein
MPVPFGNVFVQVRLVDVPDRVDDSALRSSSVRIRLDDFNERVLAWLGAH